MMAAFSRIGKKQIDSKREECQRINDMLWREILAYMAMTPPTTAKDCEGSEYPWAEFIAMKVESLREKIEESNMLIARLDGLRGSDAGKSRKRNGGLIWQKTVLNKSSVPGNDWQNV